MAVAVALPAIWLNRMAIYGYYIVEQGRQIAISQIEFPAEGIVAALLYYPKSLLRDHVGVTLAFSAFAVAALAAGLWFLRGNRHRPAGPTLLPVREASIFLATCAFVVMAALNLNTTRSPVVIGILVPVFSWFVFVTFFALMRRSLAAGDRVAQWTCAGAALLAVAFGFGAQVAHFNRHMAFLYQRVDTNQIVELYDAMGQVSERAGWGAPMFTTDSMRDYFVAGAPTAVYYERHGVLDHLCRCPGRRRSPVLSAARRHPFAARTNPLFWPSRTVGMRRAALSKS